MRAECYFCHLKTVQKLIEKYKPDKETEENLIYDFHNQLSGNWDIKNPELATKLHRIAKNNLKNHDLYALEKKITNDTIMNNYNNWLNVIQQSADPFRTAARLAVVGNIIDYGAHSLNGDLNNQIFSLLSRDLKIDHTDLLKKSLENASSVLYLGDNAGEIVFDRLFIETMQHNNITFVTRGMPVINDVVLNDARQIGLDKICKVISNGYDAPSTLTEFCSEEFLEVYLNSDLIISKGQGNFEGLMNKNHQNIFFMLIAKCNPMAELLKVNKNDMVIIKPEKN